MFVDGKLLQRLIYMILKKIRDMKLSRLFQELMKKGFNAFERLDENIPGEIPYFTRMAERKSF